MENSDKVFPQTKLDVKLIAKYILQIKTYHAER